MNLKNEKRIASLQHKSAPSDRLENPTAYDHQIGVVNAASSQTGQTCATKTPDSIGQIMDLSAVTKKCPFCAETIQAAAIKCRFCGEMLRDTRLKEKASIWTRPINESAVFRRVMGAIIVGVFVFGIGGTYLWEQFREADPNRPVSSITFAEFDSNFSDESRTTDEQKARLFAHYKGMRVRWQGIVENVDGNTLCLQEKATTLTFDVMVDMVDGERSELALLGKGDLVTYEGTISDYGTLVAHHLKGGRIVDHNHLSTDERVAWLAKSQTAALEPIVGPGNHN